MNKKGLGRGLQALLPKGNDGYEETDRIIEIPVEKIKINVNQPRHSFDEDKLNELALSIKEHGVVQPVIVRPNEDGVYELVAGERRWRACKRIGLEKIPAIVKHLSRKETSEIALIENIQREDLNPIEEADAYRTLMEEFGLTQEELSKRVGKSRPFIANAVRLLALPEQVKTLVLNGQISAGHARALLALPRLKEQEDVAKRIAINGLSVRQAEKAVKDLLADRGKPRKRMFRSDPVLVDLEEKLRKRYSTKVIIRNGNKGGRIEIEYYSEEELQRLLESLLGEEEV